MSHNRYRRGGGGVVDECCASRALVGSVGAKTCGTYCIIFRGEVAAAGSVGRVVVCLAGSTLVRV